MRIIRASNEDEMVLAFLKAEIDSPHWQGRSVNDCLRALGATRALIDNAIIDNPAQNRARVECLGCCRGYKRNCYLFSGFPNSVNWQRVGLALDELIHVKYLNQAGGWITGSGGTRLVSDGARNLDALPEAQKIRAIEAEVRRGSTFPELILVGKDNSGTLVLVEGHSRATAYVRAAECLPDGIETIAGFAPDMDKWYWY